MHTEKSPSPSFQAIVKTEIQDDRASIDRANLFEEGYVDAVYEAKALLLNRAVQEGGMGKYQVRSSLLCVNICADHLIVVVPIHCCRLWVVRVRTLQSRVIISSIDLLRHTSSDSVWPVRPCLDVQVVQWH